MSRLSSMGTRNQAARDSAAMTDPSSLPSNDREKLTGGVPLNDQQVTLPQYLSPSLKMEKEILGVET